MSSLYFNDVFLYDISDSSCTVTVHCDGGVNAPFAVDLMCEAT